MPQPDKFNKEFYNVMKKRDFTYKRIHIPSTYGTYIQIKLDEEGIVYDIFDKDDELIQECGYDFYDDLGLEKTKIQ